MLGHCFDDLCRRASFVQTECDCFLDSPFAEATRYLHRFRSHIQSLVESISPFDEVEAAHQARVLEWIKSGAGLFRIRKPATPSPHLVAYFVVVDLETRKLLLVDHKNACLWLPTGGHVERGEHPRETVQREVREELEIQAVFVFDYPLFVTVAETVGLTAGHTDVTLWYALQGDSSTQVTFDQEEFQSVQWFAPEEIPHERSDPNLRRFIGKLNRLLLRGDLGVFAA